MVCLKGRMDTNSGIPGDSTQGSTLCSPSFFFSRNFWKGAHLEFLEVPRGPRWKGGRGLGPNCVSGGDQTPGHSTREEAHPEEARRLITTFPPLPLSPSPLPCFLVTKANSNGASEGETMALLHPYLSHLCHHSCEGEILAF